MSSENPNNLGDFPLFCGISRTDVDKTINWLYIKVNRIYTYKKNGYTIMYSIKLKNLVNIQVGYQSQKRVEEAPDSIFRLIQNKDFDARYNLKKYNLIRFKPTRKPENYSVRKNDILFQARGNVHFSYHIKHDFENTLAAASFYILRLKTKTVLPSYLVWWLNQSAAQNYFSKHAGKGQISFISKKVLSELNVIVPDMETQKKISNIMELMKKEQDLLQRLVALKSKLAQAVCLKAIKNKE